MTTLPTSCQPDSVSFISDTNSIIIATYTYFNSVRSGSLLYLKNLHSSSTPSEAESYTQTDFNFGILHANPYKFNNINYAVCACSDGAVRIFSLSHSPTLLNSVVVDPNALDSTDDRVAAGLSNGCLGVIDKNILAYTWHAHNLEVWTCCIDGNILYSGADDSTLKFWDLKNLSNDTNKSFIGEIKTFDAGVTWISTNDNDIVIGSHDNHVRWFDKRKLNEERNKIKIPGSPWKLILRDSIWYAAACQGLIHAFTEDSTKEAEVAIINKNLASKFKNLPKAEFDPLIYSIDISEDLMTATDFYNKRILFFNDINKDYIN